MCTKFISFFFLGFSFRNIDIDLRIENKILTYCPFGKCEMKCVDFCVLCIWINTEGVGIWNLEKIKLRVNKVEMSLRSDSIPLHSFSFLRSSLKVECWLKVKPKCEIESNLH